MLGYFQMTREFTKGARASFYTMLVFMGGLFWIAATTGHFRMNPDIYGPVAGHFSEDVSALGMLVPAFIYMIALTINGRRWWTPYVRLICGFMVATYFSTFILSAMSAQAGDLMVIVSTIMMCKAAVLTYVDALELFKQRGWHDGN